jgi:7-cyano-7-deazaguanine synthase in queuosine biosynthesis
MKIIHRRKTSSPHTYIHTTDAGHEIRTTTHDGYFYEASYRDDDRGCGCCESAESRRAALKKVMEKIEADDLE